MAGCAAPSTTALWLCSGLLLSCWTTTLLLLYTWQRRYGATVGQKQR